MQESIAPPKSRLPASFRFAPRAACGCKLRGVRNAGIIKRLCNGGAKAPPFQELVRSPG